MQPAGSETIRLLEQRVSVREFAPEPVPLDSLTILLDAACRAPTSSNLQTYSLVVISDAARRRELAMLAGRQPHVADAPVFVAVCADLSRVQRACSLHGVEENVDTLEMGLVASIDASLVGMSLMLAAESVGLGCVMIGALRSKPVEVAALLRLPPHAFVLFGMCLGWPRFKPPQKPRFPRESIIHFEEYAARESEESVAKYDAVLARYYDHRCKPADTRAWTKRVADCMCTLNNRALRQALSILGLRFD